MAIDVLDARLFRRLTAHPEDLGALLADVPASRPVVIYEVQKSPGLLDEVKAKETVRETDLKGLMALGEEFPQMTLAAASLEPFARRVGRVRILPVESFLQDLWNGELERHSPR